MRVSFIDQSLFRLLSECTHSYLLYRHLSPVILVEPILEKFKFDFNSDQPLDEQELEGCKRLRKYCLESIEAAKEERQARVEEAYQAQLQEEEELRIQVRTLSVSSFLSDLNHFSKQYVDSLTN